MGHSDFQAGFSRAEAPPLAAGVARGARIWNVSLLDVPAAELVGQYGHHWEPGENVAVCDLGPIDMYVSSMRQILRGAGYTIVGADPSTCDGVEPSCKCGFYAYWDMDGHSNVYSILRYGWHLAGVIEGYGRTTIGEYGFRCEKARIVALSLVSGGGSHLVDQHVRRQLEQRYGVRVYATVEEMLEDHPTDDPPETVGRPDPVEDLVTSPQSLGVSAASLSAMLVAFRPPSPQSKWVRFCYWVEDTAYLWAPLLFTAALMTLIIVGLAASS